jgi:hypothetical protein
MDHLTYGVLRRIVATRQIYSDDIVPLSVACVCRSSRARSDAGIVESAIESTEMFDCKAHGSLDLLRIRYIRYHGYRPAARSSNSGRSLLTVRAVAINRNDVRSLRGKQQGAIAPDPRSRPGNDYDLTCEHAIHG